MDEGYLRLSVESEIHLLMPDVICRWDLADALVARYANGYKCMGDIDHMIEGERIALGYPQEWLKAVGFHDYPSTLPPRSVMDGHHADGNFGESTSGDEKNGEDGVALGKGAQARLAMRGVATSVREG